MRRRWADLGLAGAWRERGADDRPFVLLDGPGDAQGTLRMGPTVNRLRKDIIARLYAMRGYAVDARPGWEVFGLPAEITALRRIPRDRYTIDPLVLRDQCRRDTGRTIARQIIQGQVLGLAAMSPESYRTSDAAHAATVLDTFADLLERGVVTTGLLPMTWCPVCRTPLAAAETNDRPDPAIRVHVACAVRRVPHDLLPDIDLARLSAVALAEPLWGLPSVTALAVDPAARYAVVGDLHDSEGFTFLVRREQVAAFGQASGMRPLTHQELPGRALLDCTFLHPLVDRELRVVAGRLPEPCLGLAALAPAHDAAAFAVAQAHDLAIPRLLGPDGVFTRAAGDVSGLTYLAAREYLLRQLDSDGALLACQATTVQVPTCWRCASPTYVQAEPQCFLDLDQVREGALNLAARVRWEPHWAGTRMTALLHDRPSWCLSRRRMWGIPLPSFICDACHEPLVEAAHVRRVADLMRDEGAEAWYHRPVGELLPEGLRCPKCGERHFAKGGDVFDVWFDAGCRYRVGEGRAALAIEGEDQVRGWLQASLLVAAACGDPAPFATVRVHGLARDGSSGDTLVGPALRHLGADVLRLWAAQASTRGPIDGDTPALKQAQGVYRRLRGTFRALLGHLHDFTPDDRQPHGALNPLDRWALHRAAGMADIVGAALEAGATPNALTAITGFCRHDLRGFYLPATLAWLRAAPADGLARRATQTAFFHLADLLARLLAPLTPYLADEAWVRLPHDAGVFSVHLADWPDVPEAWRDPALSDQMDIVLAARIAAQTVLRAARAQGTLPNSRAVEVIAYSAGETADALESFSDILAAVFQVAAVTVAPLSTAPTGAYRGDRAGLAVVVGQASGQACPRCHWWREPAGQAPHRALCAACAEVVSHATARKAA